MRGNFTGEYKLHRGGFSLSSFPRSYERPGIFFMELREIFLSYCAKLKENFISVTDPSEASVQLSTADILQEVENHWGELGDEEHPVDKTLLVTVLEECGFIATMIKGTTEMRWLMVPKYWCPL